MCPFKSSYYFFSAPEIIVRSRFSRGHSKVERGDDKAGIKKDYDHKLTSSAVFGVLARSEGTHITSFIFTEL